MEVIEALDEQETKPRRNEAPAADDTQAELADLRRRLKEAEIRAEAFEEMINVAEAMFNIPIRKKAGVKR